MRALRHPLAARAVGERSLDLALAARTVGEARSTAPLARGRNVLAHERSPKAAMKGHQPRRRFGQNFLVDPHYVERIVAAIDPQPGERIVEIGPGLAALTGQLIERAGHVTAVEIDRDLAARLRERFAPDSSRWSKAMRSNSTSPHSAATCASSATSLTTSARRCCSISPRTSRALRDLHVMLQKEVVDRMTAQAGTPDYGRLTVMLQVRFDVRATVRRSAGRVPSGAESRFGRCATRTVARACAAESTISRCSRGSSPPRSRSVARRCATPCSALCDVATIAAAGIDPGARGETLGVADFVRLANAIPFSLRRRRLPFLRCGPLARTTTPRIAITCISTAGPTACVVSETMLA